MTNSWPRNVLTLSKTSQQNLAVVLFWSFALKSFGFSEEGEMRLAYKVIDSPKELLKEPDRIRLVGATLRFLWNAVVMWVYCYCCCVVLMLYCCCDVMCCDVLWCIVLCYYSHYVQSCVIKIFIKSIFQITYSHETEPMGTAGPLALAKDRLCEKCVFFFFFSIYFFISSIPLIPF